MNRRGFLRRFGHLGLAIPLVGMVGQPNGIGQRQDKLRLFCCDCTEQILPVFDRDCIHWRNWPHQLLGANRKYAQGEILLSELETVRHKTREYYDYISMDIDRYGSLDVLSVVKASLLASAIPISWEDMRKVMRRHRWVIANERLEENLVRMQDELAWDLESCRDYTARRYAFEIGQSGVRAWQVRKLYSYLADVPFDENDVLGKPLYADIG